MINCAHPTHFEQALAGRRGLDQADPRREGQCLDQEPSPNSTSSKRSMPAIRADLGRRYRDLRRAFPAMRILGGCCGTDHRHVAAICEACLPPRALSA